MLPAGAGVAAAEYAAGATIVEMPENATSAVVAQLEAMRQRPDGERVADLRRELQETMRTQLGLRVRVVPVTPGVLPRHDGKARRVVDERAPRWAAE